MAEYIEREAAIKRFNFAVLDCLGMEPTIRAGDIIKALESIPAADVRPVVRGRWEDVNVRDYSTNINGGMPLSIASMFCPVCGRWHNEVYHYGNPTEMAHYCPNCGAMMEASDGKD